MAKLATRFLLRIPNAPEGRTLYPGTVTLCGQGLYTAELESGEENLPIEPEQFVQLLFHDGHTFLQQGAEVVGVEELEVDGDVTTTVQFRIAGEPVSAESRECYRVSTAIACHSVVVDDAHRCPVTDACATGLSFVSSEAWAAGDVVTVKLTFENQTYTGRCSVQSVRRMRRGRLRYGLYCIEDGRTRGSLPKGLQKLSMAVQREHLSRLARLR